MGEGHEKEAGRGAGQEGNRSPPLLERGSGEDSGTKTREFGNISARNPKLCPTHAKPDQGIKELLPKVNRQKGKEILVIAWRMDRTSRDLFIILGRCQFRLYCCTQETCRFIFFQPEKYFPVDSFLPQPFLFTIRKIISLSSVIYRNNDKLSHALKLSKLRKDLILNHYCKGSSVLFTGSRQELWKRFGRIFCPNILAHTQALS